jgi:pilus assembly protein CpaB
LTPSQSESLVKAKEEGRIQLTLRNPLDQRQQLAVEESKPAPAPAPVVRTAPRPAAPAQSTVTVIRGTQVATTRAGS